MGRRAGLIGLWLISMWGLCNCVVTDLDVEMATTDITHRVFSSYGFDQQGVLNVSVDLQEGSAVFLSVIATDAWDAWGALFTSAGPSMQWRVCTFPSVARAALYPGQNAFQMSVPFRDQYTLQILSCRLDNVKLVGTITYQNPSQGAASHLTLEMAQYPEVARGLVLVYSLVALAYMVHGYTNLKHVAHIHRVYCVALIVKLVQMVLEERYFTYFGLHGVQGSALYFSKEVALVVSTGLFLTAWMLIGMGWSLTRHYMTRREKQALTGSLCAYVVVGVIRAYCSTGGTLCDLLTLLEYVIRSIFMLCIIVALNFNITHLRAVTLRGPWAPSLPMQYSYMRQLNMFRMAFLAYLLLPTLLLIVRLTVLSWRFEWLGTLLQEVVLLGLVLHVATGFRPKEHPTFDKITHYHQAAVDEEDEPQQ